MWLLKSAFVGFCNSELGIVIVVILTVYHIVLILCKPTKNHRVRRGECAKFDFAQFKDKSTKKPPRRVVLLLSLFLTGPRFSKV